MYVSLSADRKHIYHNICMMTFAVSDISLRQTYTSVYKKKCPHNSIFFTENNNRLHPHGETLWWTKDIFFVFHWLSRIQFSNEHVSHICTHSARRVRIGSDVFLSLSCYVIMSKCRCELRIFAAAHTTLVSFIYLISEGSQTHFHKLQKWCSRREWHGSHWGWFLCRNRWRLHSCRESDKILNVNQTDRCRKLKWNSTVCPPWEDQHHTSTSVWWHQ